MFFPMPGLISADRRIRCGLRMTSNHFWIAQWTFFPRNARMSGAISAPSSLRAKCPVSSKCNSAPGFQERLRARLGKYSRRLREFYDSGKRWCLLDTLPLAHARRSMEFWIDVFGRLSRDATLSPAIARKRAQEAVAAVEGGLVASRVLGNPRPFLRSLANLAKQLTVSRP